MFAVIIVVSLLAGGPIRYFFPFAPSQHSEPRAGIGNANCVQAAQLGATWTYNWGPKITACANGVEAVPMLWGPGQLLEADHLAPGEYLLVGNECDSPGQCNLTPQEMATFWWVVQTRWPERRLIGSNVTQDGLAYQLAWMQAYTEMYRERPRIHALALHCYGTLDVCQPTIKAMIALAEEWSESGDVWLSEFATLIYQAGGDRERQITEAERYLAWVQAQPDIERYGWFMIDMDADPNAYYEPTIWDTGLLADGTLTPLGDVYRAVTQGRR